MRKLISTTAMVLALAACEPAVKKNDSPSAPEASEAQMQSVTLASFFESAMKDRLALKPMQAERLGFSENNDKWPEITDAAADKELALYKNQLEVLRTYDFDKLSAKDQQSYRIFEITAERFITNDRWRDYGYPVNQMFGRHTGIATHLMTVHHAGCRGLY